MASPVAESLGVLVAFSAGLFSFLSPCVLPLFPSYLSFVTGMSVDRLASDVTLSERALVMLHSLAFIAGFTVVFVSLGASFSAAGQFLLDYRDWIIAGGILIIFFGLYIAGFLQWGVLGRTRQLQIRNKPAGFIGSFAVGLTFAIGWTPCVGPILGAILTLASSESTVGHGVGLLFAYSVGLGCPSRVFLGGFFLRFFGATVRSFPWWSARRRSPHRGGRARGNQLLHSPQLVDVSLTPEWLLRRL
jgi:cytochrome c-type biogenesis protein